MTGGPYAAQIQQAIDDLLTGDNVWAGDNTFDGDTIFDGAVTFNGGITGVVSGTGVAGRVAFWDGTDNITSDADFLFDGTLLTVPRFLGSGGTPALPRFASAADPDTGIDFDLANNMILSVGGDIAAGVWFTGGVRYLYASSVFGVGSNLDILMSRAAARTMRFGNATEGVQFDATVDGTIRFLAFGGGDTAIVRASAYTVGATAGASFSGAVTNLTVVNGIVTAAS